MRSHRPHLGLVGGALVLIVAAGCGSRHVDTATTGDGDAPLAVTTVHGVSARAATLVLPARVEAREEVVVTARIPGRLTGLRFREGDAFRAGDLLAIFDAPETRQAVRSASAALEAATVRADQARLQETRMDSLFAGRVASLRERELAQAERQAAEAGLEQARAGLDAIAAGVRIAAPFDGVVVRRFADAGATLTPGQSVLAIRSRAVDAIAAAIPESELPRLAGARVRFQLGEGPWRDARLERIEGMTDFASRTRVARFRPMAAGPPLEAGAFARVRIEGRAPAAGVGALAGEQGRSVPGPLLVPARSIVRRGALTGVYVVRDEHAHLRWLRLGAAEGDDVTVLAGLEAGEAIVTDPTGLRDGRAVRVGP